MAEKNNFDGAVTSLFEGMSSFVSTKTVVGDAVHIGDTIILPLVDVSFGMAASASKKDNSKDGSTGGMGCKMSPSAVLVINNGSSKIINVKSQDSLTKILDMIPDIINKIMKKDKIEISDEEIMEAAKESMK